MATARKLEIAGLGLAFLSAFAQIFVLDRFAAMQEAGYTAWIMENQAMLSHMLRAIALGVETGDLDQNAFAQASAGIRLYSTTYDWAAELFVARAIVGVAFILGAVAALAGKIMEPPAARR